MKAPNNLVPGGKDNYHLKFSQESERNHKQRKKEGEGKVGYFVLEKQLNECELWAMMINYMVKYTICHIIMFDYDYKLWIVH